ncbi:MAG: hypothetical protein IT285_15830 [Bdellovibrionales bacterium]|nr:hypothetical protein [Bdellovibrionales bacterium]
MIGGTAGNAVYTTDGGQNWVLAPDAPSIPTSSAAFTSTAGRVIATGTGGDISISTDGGQNWNESTDVGGTTEDLLELSYSAGMLYAGSNTSQELLRSIDEGANWTEINLATLGGSGTQGGAYRTAIATSTSLALTGNVNLNTRFFEINPGGNSFAEVAPSDARATDPIFRMTLTDGGQTAVAVGGERAVYRSGNSGGAWSRVYRENAASDLLEIECLDEINVCVAAGMEGFAMISFDSGATWENLPSPSPDLGPVDFRGLALTYR